MLTESPSELKKQPIVAIIVIISDEEWIMRFEEKINGGISIVPGFYKEEESEKLQDVLAGSEDSK